MLGYNYRMDEFRAAVGLAQLRKLKAWNQKRGALTRTYRSALKTHCPEIAVPFSIQTNSSYHIMPIVLPPHSDRRSVMERLRDSEIQATIHYPAVHELSFYRGLQPSVRLEITEEFARRELTLPLHPRMEASQVEGVATALASALRAERLCSAAPGSLTAQHRHEALQAG